MPKASSDQTTRMGWARAHIRWRPAPGIVLKTRHAPLFLLFRKSRPMQVLLGDGRYRQRPIDCKRRIIVSHAIGKFWSVARGNQITDFDVIAEGLKAVGEASWNVELAAIRGRKLKFLPLAVGR